MLNIGQFHFPLLLDPCFLPIACKSYTPSTFSWRMLFIYLYIIIPVTSPLKPSILSEAGVTAGYAAKVAECRTHDMNDPKCSVLGWKCTPLAVETYGCWGAEARETLAVETYGCWGAEARETLAVETYGCWGAEARETLAVETYGCWGAEAKH